MRSESDMTSCLEALIWGGQSTIGFNTTFLSASHPSYTSQQHVLGRGIQSVQRLDFLLNGA